ncbi:MAG: NifU N-terminal domain-containing protein [Desulfatiglandaceae bacterium]
MNSESRPPKPSQVLVYRHPNLDIRSFLTSKEISSYRVEYFKRASFEQAADSLKALGAIGKQAIREIMALPGVEEVHIKPRELRIKKRTSISWNDIEPKIIKILQRAVRKKQIVRIK